MYLHSIARMLRYKEVNHVQSNLIAVEYRRNFNVSISKLSLFIELYYKISQACSELQRYLNELCEPILTMKFCQGNIA